MTERDIAEITEHLLAKGTAGQVKYTTHVLKETKPVIGIRLPELRNIAKQIAKEDYRFFMEHCPVDYFEQEILKAYTIGYAKDEIETILSYADTFIPTIHDWAVNDAFCQNFTIARKHRERVFTWLEGYAEKQEEFSQRVVAVLLMSHFLTDEYIERVLRMMNVLQFPAYYTRMGVAWCIATAYAKYPKETHAFLLDNRLEDWTFNKAIQKMRESFRISKEDKEILNQMKRVKKTCN